MVDYQLQTSRGDPIIANNHMSIYQYPNTGGDDNEVENKMLTALEHMCDELYENTRVDYYEISVTYDHPNLGNDDSTTGCDSYGLINRFDGYLYDKNPPVGSHVLVTDYVPNACANLGDGGDTAFNGNPQRAVVGTEFPEQAWKNSGIHEVMHNFIDADVIPADLYKDSHGGADRHHDLGKVYCDILENPTSPMCTGYENKHGDHGQCSDNCGFDQVYDMTLTDCAFTAIDQTAGYY